MSHIVLLEDELELREEVAAFLQKRGWQVTQAGSVAEFSHCMGIPEERDQQFVTVRESPYCADERCWLGRPIKC